METEVITFKVKREGVRWEDTEAHEVQTFTGKDLADITRQASDEAMELSQEVKTEIRWNFAGSPQGHYVMAR